MALEQHWPAVQSGIKAVNLDPDWPDGHLTLARAQLNYGEVVPSSFSSMLIAMHKLDLISRCEEFSSTKQPAVITHECFVILHMLSPL